MQVNFTWRNADKTEALEQLVIKKLDRLQNHCEKIDSIQITFQHTHQSFEIKVSCQLRKTVVHASASSDDMYKSIDEMIKKLSRQIDELHEKHRD
jgi:putative sigma-54 modulation protein